MASQSAALKAKLQGAMNQKADIPETPNYTSSYMKQLQGEEPEQAKETEAPAREVQVTPSPYYSVNLVSEQKPKKAGVRTGRKVTYTNERVDIHIKIDKELKEKLDAISMATHIPLQSIIISGINEELKKYEINVQ